MNKYPMRLIPHPREMIWGGNRLKTKYNKPAPFDSVGESWELTIRPEAQSIIGNGEYEGKRLCDVIGQGSDFPLLIKFIDARDDLSVQVHPDDDITDENGSPLGKTEMWYIIDAERDAFIIYGLSDGYSVDDLAAMVERNDFESGLKKVFVRPGDCYFIPAGQVHAIGKGILLAEIQQNSDTTYRFYDYGRLGNDGKPRELHVEKALKVTKARTEGDINAIRYSRGFEADCLANCEKFKCLKLKATTSSKITVASGNSFTALVFIEGNGTVIHNGKQYPVAAGDTYYVPEGIDVDIIGELTLLSATPS